MPLIINGETVPEEVLDQEFSQIKSHYEQQGGISCCERDPEFRGYANENIIARTLLTQEARRQIDPVSPPEVDTAIRKLKEEHGGEEKFYRTFNLEPGQDDPIRRDLESSLRVQKLLDGICRTDAETDRKELREFYEKSIDRYMNPEKIRVSHILKGAARGEDRRKVYAQLRGLREQILDGADFDELARQHSEKYEPQAGDPPPDADAPRGDGIDLGFFAQGELMEELEMVTFSMRVGEVSPIFASPYGTHLAKLVQRRPASPKPFDEVAETVKQDFLQARREENVRAFVETLRSKATIEQPEEEDEAPAAE